MHLNKWEVNAVGMKRIGLVMPGGGNRGAVFGGVVLAFEKAGIQHDFFVVSVGTSVGIATIPFFSTKQIAQGLNYFTQHLPFGYPRSYYGIPYADRAYIEWAFRYSKDALDIKKLRSSRTKSYAALSDPITQKAKYVCLNTAEDPILVLLQAINTPLFTHPKIVAKECLWDAGITDYIPLGCPELHTVDEIWFVSPFPIDHRPGKRGGWTLYFYSWLVYLLGDPQTARLIAKAHQRECQLWDEIHERVDIKIICPDKQVPVSWRTNDPRLMKIAIQMGLEAGRKFLKKQNI